MDKNAKPTKAKNTKESTKQKVTKAKDEKSTVKTKTTAAGEGVAARGSKNWKPNDVTPEV